MCRICSIVSPQVRDAIEGVLTRYDGVLSQEAKAKLVDSYPEYAQQILEINAKDAEIHFNFHQAASRTITLPDAEEKPRTSLAEDIAKDESAILLEVLNMQHATFTALTNKVNGTLQKIKEGELTGLVINPTTVQFYKELGDSLRATVREIRELNAALNGRADGSVEGLKALAAALGGQRNEPPAVEMTTQQFDD